MSDLLKAYAEKTKAYTKRPQETVEVSIKAIRGTKDDRRVMLETTKGSFFAFKDTFPQGVAPVINKPLPATITLEQVKVGDVEYINVVDIQFDTEALGKYNLAATYGNAIVL